MSAKTRVNIDFRREQSANHAKNGLFWQLFSRFSTATRVTEFGATCYKRSF
jgi:hypothetical protein